MLVQMRLDLVLPGPRETHKAQAHGVQGIVLGQVGKQADLRRDGLTWKDFVEQGFIIAGSPKTVRERLREAMKTLNCGHLMMLMQIGSMPPDLVKASTELFAKEVMPYMRDLWSEWEDKWSPKRMPEIQAPAPVHFENRGANGQTRPAAGIQSEVRSAK